MSDPRTINVKSLKENSLKPLVSIRLKDLSDVDLVAELITDYSDNVANPNLNYIEIKNPYLLLPVQDPTNPSFIKILPRPWNMTAAKDQSIIIMKNDILVYFELVNKEVINFYINATSDIKIATPDDIPNNKDGVISIVRK